MARGNIECGYLWNLIKPISANFLHNSFQIIHPISPKLTPSSYIFGSSIPPDDGTWVKSFPNLFVQILASLFSDFVSPGSRERSLIGACSFCCLQNLPLSLSANQPRWNQQISFQASFWAEAFLNVGLFGLFWFKFLPTTIQPGLFL